MSSQSPGTPTGTISGLQLGSPGKKSHLNVASTKHCREYYMGEGGGFPRVQAVVSLVCQSARGLSQHPRVFPNVNWFFVVYFGCRFKFDLLVPRPSLIPGLLARPSTPLLCWKSRTPFESQLSATLHSWTFKWVQPGNWECVTLSLICGSMEEDQWFPVVAPGPLPGPSWINPLPVKRW
jgi:hypothetical protein